jgi:hypothetical protein
MAQPFDQHLLIAFFPGASRSALKELADDAVLLEDGLFGIHRHELEDLGQGLILFDDAPDELRVTGEGVTDLGDILAGFVVAGGAVGGDAFTGGFRRKREI